MDKEYKDLGFMNDWYQNPPEEYQKCRSEVASGEKHEINGLSIGRCASRITCHTCKISWSIDSSD